MSLKRLLMLAKLEMMFSANFLTDFDWFGLMVRSIDSADVRMTYKRSSLPLPS